MHVDEALRWNDPSGALTESLTSFPGPYPLDAMDQSWTRRRVLFVETLHEEEMLRRAGATTLVSHPRHRPIARAALGQLVNRLDECDVVRPVVLVHGKWWFA